MVKVIVVKIQLSITHLFRQPVNEVVGTEISLNSLDEKAAAGKAVF